MYLTCLLISLVLYAIGFSLRSCLYEPVNGDIFMAKRIRSHRIRKKTPRWQAVLFILGLPIPILNILFGVIAVAWGVPDLEDDEFYVFENKLISNFIRKIINFFNKPLWVE